MLLLLDLQPGMVVVGITDRLSGLLLQLDASQPDVLLLEWELPFPVMADLLAKIHMLGHPPEVILFSNKPEEEEVLKAAGADHFIVKNAPPDDLIPILNQISTQGNLNHSISILT